MYRFFCITIITFFFGVMPSFGFAKNIDWYSLDLNNTQKMQICTLDKEWRETSSDLRVSLSRYQAQLKSQLQNKLSTDSDIKYTQKQIQIRQQQLQNAATDIFLRKRQVLNPYQRQRLHEMISNCY